MKKHLIHLLVLALVLPGLFMQMGCSKAPKKNIGLQLYSVRDDMKTDPAGTLAKVGKMGYTSVEAAGYSNGTFYGMSPADFKAVVEKNGMTFLSSHVGHALPDSANWAATMAWWDTCIDAHAAAGVKYLVQPSMSDTAYKSIAMLQKYCDYFDAIGAKCNAKGIQFGYHNHTPEFQKIDSVMVYDYMLTHTDPSKVFFEMDLYWVHEGGQDPVAYFQKYPGRFLLWHVKDEKEVGASGKMDFKTIFENAQLSGMKYPIVEMEASSTTPLEGVQKSIDFLLKADYVK